MVDTALPILSVRKPSDHRGTETIFVVDDDSFVRNVCTAVLTHAGYRTFSAEGGQLALQMIEAMPRPIDLALFDVRMPRMTGPALVRELLERGRPSSRDMKFVLMSGYPETEMDAVADRFGIRYSFLQKPFSPSALLGAVRRELDATHLIRQSV